MMRFDERTVVITGGEMGIGRATAARFAEAGARVVILGVDENAGSATASDLGEQVDFRRTDVTKSDEVAQAADWIRSAHGLTGVLVNNAGIYGKGDVLSLEEKDWRRTLDVNVTGMFLMTKHIVPQMIERGGGVVVNVGSEAGLVAIGDQVAYNVSKAAVIQFTKCLAVDLAKHSIRANTVCPGTTMTPLVENALEQSGDPEGVKRHLEQIRPMNRLGKPEEIAAAIVAMASDELGYATGTVCSIDGGYTAQ
ncbi:MAG: SDR family NAD(P)-dependent oxidoreductase [Spirochaetaceae bacterium]